MWEDKLAIVESEKRKVNLVLKNKCEAYGIENNPLNCDDYGSKIYGRVYLEARGNRDITIDLIEEGLPYFVDGFIKKTGIDYERNLLMLFYNPKRYSADNFWNIYHEWIHNNASNEIIEKMLRELFSERP